MGKKLLKAVIIGSALSFAMAMVPSCAPTQSDNGGSTAQLASDEVANMGSDVGTVMSTGGAGKIVATADTSYINWTVHPYQWDATSQSFVRTASLTTSKGYVRTRTDTITFRDASGNAVRSPSMATVSTIHHVRHVEQSKGDISATLDLDVIDTLHKGSDTTFVKNGTITGTCDGQQVASGTITGVTRLFENGKWQFPSSGTIVTSMPRYTLDIQYIGNGEATATIHNLVNNKTRVVTLIVDER